MKLDRALFGIDAPLARRQDSPSAVVGCGTALSGEDASLTTTTRTRSTEEAASRPRTASTREDANPYARISLFIPVLTIH